MSDAPAFEHFAFPVHTAGVVCDVCTSIGLPLPPARLRSWHTLEGLELGSSGDGWRRYSDGDVLAVALLCAFNEHGFKAGELTPAIPEILAVCEGSMHHGDQAPDLVVTLVRERGNGVKLDAGTREQIFTDPALMRLPRPVSLIDLSSLSAQVRKALVASPHWAPLVKRFLTPGDSE